LRCSTTSRRRLSSMVMLSFIKYLSNPAITS
jgi:hypothetical protein